MLFPRCIHRRLRCILLHEFHTTHRYLRESLGAFQIDITAHAIIDSRPSSPRRSQSNSDSRENKTLRAGKRRKEKSDRMEYLFDSDALSSRLQLRNRRVLGPHKATLLKERLASLSAPTECEAHLGASENAGGSSYSFYAVLFHRLLPSTVRSQ